MARRPQAGACMPCRTSHFLQCIAFRLRDDCDRCWPSTVTPGCRPSRQRKMATTKRKSKEPKLNTYRGGPDEQGFFGLFGGRFVAETLMPLILDLERAYGEAKADPAFQKEIAYL